MKLIEESTVPDTELPVEALKAHLRLGTGFGEDSLQDEVLIGFLRAAIAAIEARTSKALFRRDFSMTLNAWQRGYVQPLPVAPVSGIVEVTLRDSDGDETVLTVDQYWLVDDAHAPEMRPSGAFLPSIPGRGSAKIRFTAGIADNWDSLPPDLVQAVMLLAAHYYEYRHETALSDGCMPFGVTSLIQRYRPLRLTLGASQ